MKKLIAAVMLVLIGLAVYVGAGPFITMHRINSAIVAEDSARLAEEVDFESLRQSLSEQFSARVVAKSQQQMDENPFAAIAAGFASLVVEKMVNAMVTPAGVIALIRESSDKARDKKPPAQDTKKEPSTPAESDAPATDENAERRARDDMFAGAAFEFYDADLFVATVGTRPDNSTRFAFKREGLRWKLSNIVLPAE